MCLPIGTATEYAEESPEGVILTYSIKSDGFFFVVTLDAMRASVEDPAGQARRVIVTMRQAD